MTKTSPADATGEPKGIPHLTKPPIFPGPGVDESSQQYLHRARMFRHAAEKLPDLANGETFWPRYALVTHAIELALKAFVRHCVENGQPKVKEPSNHDLSGWYQLALNYGLQHDPIIAENVALLDELHNTHYSRYPQHRSKPIPAGELILDPTVDQLIATFSQIINAR
jgi:hypothetical protein